MLAELALLAALSTADACQFDIWVIGDKQEVSQIEGDVTCATEWDAVIVQEDVLLIKMPHHSIFVQLPDKEWRGHVRYKFGDSYAHTDDNWEFEVALMSKEEI